VKVINANAKTINALLKDQKYKIDYYQREYRWEERQIEEIIDDFTSTFFDDYQPHHQLSDVAQYGNYFLGSIIISNKGNERFIVDGQQRLTTLTLLLTHMRRLLADKPHAPNLDSLIYADVWGQPSFNIHVDERNKVMKSLFDGEAPMVGLESESVANLLARHQDIAAKFPYDQNDQGEHSEVERFDDRSLVHFAYWLINKVFLVEIVADSDRDAYTIFETTNDRGLSLTPTDMLKGHVLANITDENKRFEANATWRDTVAHLNKDEHEASADFCKTWLRSQYGRTIRTSTGATRDHDFDRIGAEFHRWVRDEAKYIGLLGSDDFNQFIERDMDFYAGLYDRIQRASAQLALGLEHIRYNGHRGFTLQPMLLMAPVRMNDSEDAIRKKLRLCAIYLDIYLGWKEWNSRRTGQAMMKVPIFNAMKRIRDKTDPADLAAELFALINEESELIVDDNRFGLNKTNGGIIHRILARFTEYVEKESGKTLDYDVLVSNRIRNRYQVEHIWANFYSRHRDEFDHQRDFEDHRNLIGDLVLLPSNINQAHGGDAYAKKARLYVKENMLARSLHPDAYVREPGFSEFINLSELPFHAHGEFKMADVLERQRLYTEIAKQIWNPGQLLREIGHDHA
jgi:hypothetical protein